MTMTET